MKNIYFVSILFLIVFSYSCKDKAIDADFDELEQSSIYDYLVDNKEEFSDLISILEKGGILQTLSVYNPHGTGYTLFAPDNQAIQEFIEQSPLYSSLNDLLEDEEFASLYSKYHVLNMKAHTNEFPFGAFPQPTLSDDFLTVNFVIEEDTSYYKINNHAAVIKPNIEVSNGFIHHIQRTLQPVNVTSYYWLDQNPEFSIFKEAVDLTGLKSSIDFNVKGAQNIQSITMLLESNSVYNEVNIFSISDLINVISSDRDDFTDESNPLYNFVAYHILTGRYFLDDFFGSAQNYVTLSEVPLNINGLGLDLYINKGKQVFDTLVIQEDTTFIDYVGFKYDESNVITQSGPIHFIDRMMKSQTPSRSISVFEFNEEPLLSQYRKQGGGTFLLDNTEQINRLVWEGGDLWFIDLGETSSSARDADYLRIDGDFSISYTIPKIVQGTYKVFLGAHSMDVENAFIEVLIDGSKYGDLIDLTKGGSASNPFRKIELGIINFNQYEEHIVTINSVIPGNLLWDYIRFEPY